MIPTRQEAKNPRTTGPVLGILDKGRLPIGRVEDEQGRCAARQLELMGKGALHLACKQSGLGVALVIIDGLDRGWQVQLEEFGIEQ